QSAFSFSSTPTLTTVNDLCTTTNTATLEDFSMPTPGTIILTAGPFAEQGMAIDLVPDKYLVESTALVKNGDTTTQLWTKLDAVPAVGNGAWVWSDQDLDAGGGLGVVIFDDGPGPQLGLSTCT